MWKSVKDVRKRKVNYDENSNRLYFEKWLDNQTLIRNVTHINVEQVKICNDPPPQAN